jgi:hypothetical protein
MGRQDDNASQNVAIEIETSVQIGYGDSIMVELSYRR